MAALVSFGFPNPCVGSLQRELNDKEAVLLLSLPLCPVLCVLWAAPPGCSLTSAPSTRAQVQAHACAHLLVCSSMSTGVCALLAPSPPSPPLPDQTPPEVSHGGTWCWHRLPAHCSQHSG